VCQRFKEARKTSKGERVGWFAAASRSHRRQAPEGSLLHMGGRQTVMGREEVGSRRKEEKAMSFD